jgi:DNA-binding HxlR family transcriptional regulator
LHFASTNIQTTFILQVLLINFMEKIKKRSNCPISCSLDLWGDKWSLLIIRDLMYKTACTYGDFLKSEEKIATNILATRLQNLEQSGFIQKHPHPNSKAKVLYTLTEKGIDLLPILVEIHLWTEKYGELPQAVQTLLIDVKKNKDLFIKTTTEQLKKNS